MRTLVLKFLEAREKAGIAREDALAEFRKAGGPSHELMRLWLKPLQSGGYVRDAGLRAQAMIEKALRTLGFWDKKGKEAKADGK